MASPQVLDSNCEIPPEVVRNCRIIWAALVLGELVFVAVTVVLQLQGARRQNNLPVLLLAVADVLAFFGGIILALVARRVMADPEADEHTLRAKYAITTLIPMACLGGASFTGLALVMLTSRWWPLGVVPAISVLVQLPLFPRSVVKRRGPR